MEQRCLVIAQRLIQRIIEHCMEEKPLEACGILTGRDGRVLDAYATENSRRSQVEYEVDPVQQQAVLEEMKRRGDQLMAIYHSHPRTPAKPSYVDIQMAVNWPEAVRVIISMAGPAEMRAFLIHGGQVQNVSIHGMGEMAGTWHDMRRGASRPGGVGL